MRPFGVMEKASPCEDKMMVECQASQQMKSDDSGSFDTEDMVLDRLILLREEEDTSEVGNHHNHTASSSNSWRSSPESESSSKSWFQWSKRRKVTNMVRDLEGETMKPSSFHQDNLSENGKVS